LYGIMTRGCIRKFPDWPPGELQMVQLSATRCSCITILWANLVSFAPITLYVASQRVFIFVVVCFVMTQSGNVQIYTRICMETSIFGDKISLKLFRVSRFAFPFTMSWAVLYWAVFVPCWAGYESVIMHMSQYDHQA
jgi:hypothetical protein